MADILYPDATYKSAMSQMMGKLAAAPYHFANLPALILPIAFQISQIVNSRDYGGMRLSKADAYWLCEILLWEYFFPGEDDQFPGIRMHNPSTARSSTNGVPPCQAGISLGMLSDSPLVRNIPCSIGRHCYKVRIGTEHDECPVCEQEELDMVIAMSLEEEEAEDNAAEEDVAEQNGGDKEHDIAIALSVAEEAVEVGLRDFQGRAENGVEIKMEDDVESLAEDWGREYGLGSVASEDADKHHPENAVPVDRVQARNLLNRPPPTPFVEEVESLARECDAPILDEEIVPNRGTVHQLPILIEAGSIDDMKGHLWGGPRKTRSL